MFYLIFLPIKSIWFYFLDFIEWVFSFHCTIGFIPTIGFIKKTNMESALNFAKCLNVYKECCWKQCFQITCMYYHVDKTELKSTLDIFRKITDEIRTELKIY